MTDSNFPLSDFFIRQRVWLLGLLLNPGSNFKTHFTHAIQISSLYIILQTQMNRLIPPKFE